ncbi:hypothetical protein KC872_04760 [Candidatus Kaiserbacteria bacterium]|nr:hypothetical protein [Candidatus Kaiserbacteria bacterium]
MKYKNIMNRPNIENFKPKYTKGVAEIASVAKQYVKAQEDYIDYLEQQVKNLRSGDVVRRSEQLTCEMCGGKIDREDKFTDERHCENCGWF